MRTLGGGINLSSISDKVVKVKIDPKVQIG